MKQDFSKADIGTKVWDIEHGWGEIVSQTSIIRLNPWRELPGITVKFENEKSGPGVIVVCQYDMQGYRNTIPFDKDEYVKDAGKFVQCLFNSESVFISNGFIM
jgi:hypothetical protein